MKIKTDQKFYLGALILSLIALFLPWIRIPFLGSISLIDFDYGFYAIIVLLALLGIYFYKRSYSYLGTVSFLGGSAFYTLYILIRTMFEGINLGFGVKISGFSFIGIGLYLFTAAGIYGSYKAFKSLRRKKSEMLKAAVFVAILVFIGLIFYI